MDSLIPLSLKSVKKILRNPYGLFLIKHKNQHPVLIQTIKIKDYEKIFTP